VKSDEGSGGKRRRDDGEMDTTELGYDWDRIREAVSNATNSSTNSSDEDLRFCQATEFPDSKRPREAGPSAVTVGLVAPSDDDVTRSTKAAAIVGLDRRGKDLDVISALVFAAGRQGKTPSTLTNTAVVPAKVSDDNLVSMSSLIFADGTQHGRSLDASTALAEKPDPIPPDDQAGHPPQ